uniref:Uncharacterized protein n=1 Tax=Anguilla anguilla TaxID=7936 RepID=A0A0E9WIK3_ANGAN
MFSYIFFIITCTSAPVQNKTQNKNNKTTTTIKKKKKKKYNVYI